MSHVLHACYIAVNSVQRAQRRRFWVPGRPTSAIHDQQGERYDERCRDQQARCDVTALWNVGRSCVSRIGKLSKPIALGQIASIELLDIALERLNEQVARVAVGAFVSLQFRETPDQQVAVVDVSQRVLRLLEHLNRVAALAQAGRVRDFERIAKLLRSDPDGVDAFGEIYAARTMATA